MKRIQRIKTLWTDKTSEKSSEVANIGDTVSGEDGLDSDNENTANFELVASDDETSPSTPRRIFSEPLFKSANLVDQFEAAPTVGDCAPLFGRFRFHDRIPVIREFWRYRRYRVRESRSAEPSGWNDRYVVDYPIRRFIARPLLGLAMAVLFFVVVWPLSARILNQRRQAFERQEERRRNADRDGSTDLYLSEMDVDESRASLGGEDSSRPGQRRRRTWKHLRRHDLDPENEYPARPREGSATLDEQSRRTRSRRTSPTRGQSVSIRRSEEIRDGHMLKQGWPGMVARRRRAKSLDTEMGGRGQPE